MGQLGAPEILLILLVVVLLFGAKKLPELARGSGRALRIFKSETKGLIEDDKSEEKPELGTGAHPATGASTTTTTQTVSASHPVEESGSSDSRY
jgi:sec-independent protein translocase protein TatA